MRHNITKRLMLYFTLVLLLFAIIAGTLFYIIFSYQSIAIYKNDLGKRASSIASALSGYMQDTNAMKIHLRGQGNGYGAYLRFIHEIAMSDVWVVDRYKNTVAIGNSNSIVNYVTPPAEMDTLLSDVFKDSVSFRENISGISESPSISVGAPVRDAGGNVVAAVLLHTHVADIDTLRNHGIHILLIAPLLGIAVAVNLSRRFTEPLTKMQQSTTQLAAGNYLVRTEVVQSDEIGTLAENIDILAQKLHKAEQESAELEQMRKDYISNISHELRTPVTVIRGSLEALYDGIIAEPQKVKEYHSALLQESIHLEWMVNDLLELSRLQNPSYAIGKVRLNVVDVLLDAIRSMRSVALKK